MPVSPHTLQIFNKLVNLGMEMPAYIDLCLETTHAGQTQAQIMDQVISHNDTLLLSWLEKPMSTHDLTALVFQAESSRNMTQKQFSEAEIWGALEYLYNHVFPQLMKSKSVSSRHKKLWEYQKEKFNEARKLEFPVVWKSESVQERNDKKNSAEKINYRITHYTFVNAKGHKHSAMSLQESAGKKIIEAKYFALVATGKVISEGPTVVNGLLKAAGLPRYNQYEAGYNAYHEDVGIYGKPQEVVFSVDRATYEEVRLFLQNVKDKNEAYSIYNNNCSVAPKEVLRVIARNYDAKSKHKMEIVSTPNGAERFAKNLSEEFNEDIHEKLAWFDISKRSRIEDTLQPNINFLISKLFVAKDGNLIVPQIKNFACSLHEITTDLLDKMCDAYQAQQSSDLQENQPELNCTRFLVALFETVFSRKEKLSAERCRLFLAWMDTRTILEKQQGYFQLLRSVLEECVVSPEEYIGTITTPFGDSKNQIMHEDNYHTMLDAYEKCKEMREQIGKSAATHSADIVMKETAALTHELFVEQAHPFVKNAWAKVRKNFSVTKEELSLVTCVKTKTISLPTPPSFLARLFNTQAAKKYYGVNAVNMDNEKTPNYLQRLFRTETAVAQEMRVHGKQMFLANAQAFFQARKNLSEFESSLLDLSKKRSNSNDAAKDAKLLVSLLRRQTHTYEKNLSLEHAEEKRAQEMVQTEDADLQSLKNVEHDKSKSVAELCLVPSMTSKAREEDVDEDEDEDGEGEQPHKAHAHAMHA